MKEDKNSKKENIKKTKEAKVVKSVKPKKKEHKERRLKSATTEKEREMNFASTKKVSEKTKTIKEKKEIKSAETVKSSEFDIPLVDLLEAGCHFGHQSRRWNPKMKPYIYCSRDGVHIFDLAQTAKCLQTACLAAKEFVSKGGVILFLGTKRQAAVIVKKEAIKAGAPYVTVRWLGGTISNWQEIKKRLEKLAERKEKKEKGEYDKYTKKENVLIDREISRLERFFGGMSGLDKTPDALFIVDVNKEMTAVREARRRGIKIFAIADSNSDPDLIDYPIPANDDAVKSIELIVRTFGKAVEEGMGLRKKLGELG